MITQLFNSWQTLSKQANTYRLDSGVSEFVCFLTGPPWGRRSCTRDRSHSWHTQQEGSNGNGTSTATVLLEDTGLAGGSCRRALLGKRKRGQAVGEAPKQADTLGRSLHVRYRSQQHPINGQDALPRTARRPKEHRLPSCSDTCTSS